MFSGNQNINASSAPDHRLIDDEHAHLAQLLSDLRDTCGKPAPEADCRACSTEKMAACQGVLPSYFHDFHEFSLMHFEHEEDLMRDVLLSEAGEAHLHLHREAHKILMREINRLIQASHALSQQGYVAEAIRQFHLLILDKFGEHTARFDDQIEEARLTVATGVAIELAPLFKAKSLEAAGSALNSNQQK